VISGPAHEAMVILGVLRDLCRTPTLLAGFKRADLKDLNGYRTLLISEPNLDNRTAALLGNLTNQDFMLVDQGSYLFDDLADLYLAQVADLREFAQATEAGEGTLHLEDALRYREIRRADLYRQFEQAASSPPPIPWVVAPNELDLPEDN
jgi:hypothetical protein